MSPRLKFAVVREDPDLESALVRRLGARAALVVASGGCTALTLKARFPELAVTAFDLNPAQLEHVREKARAVAAQNLVLLNVGDARPNLLNQRGDFERLFRVLRQVLVEFVAPPAQLEAFFLQPGADRLALLSTWTASPYWPVAFQLAFHDGLLNAMFGPAATQHAAPGSYPAYFQRAFERGLAREGAQDNPFLQHVLLGCYLLPSAPDYVTAGRELELELELVAGTLLDVARVDRFDLFSLSNVFDWSDDALVRDWAELLKAYARPGSAVLLRQLNNQRDLRRFFAPAYRFDDALGAELLALDRSLFYERIEVGFRV